MESVQRMGPLEPLALAACGLASRETRDLHEVNRGGEDFALTFTIELL
jgi:hypothetical protein